MFDTLSSQFCLFFIIIFWLGRSAASIQQQTANCPERREVRVRGVKGPGATFERLHWRTTFQLLLLVPGRNQRCVTGDVRIDRPLLVPCWAPALPHRPPCGAAAAASMARFRQ